MNDSTYWKTHYAIHGDAEEIAKHLRIRQFASQNELLDLVSFENETNTPNILIS